MEKRKVQKQLKRMIAFVVALSLVLCSNAFVVIAPEKEAKVYASQQDIDAIMAENDPFETSERKQKEQESPKDDRSLLVKLKCTSKEAKQLDKEVPAWGKNLGISDMNLITELTSKRKQKLTNSKESSAWFKLKIKKNESIESVGSKLEQMESIINVDWNYQREISDGTAISGQGKHEESWYFDHCGIRESMEQMEELGYAGGKTSVVVAVIDTGVDYTHKYLKNSMWVNTKETPNNGIDDDGNGYVDDVYGACTVGSNETHSGNPMDDHGHGTHVSGIIAANGKADGMLGIAYNTKIMAIKAGQASGYFNDSDIIEAINYAVDMGADVINMSFGGYSRSAAVEDALSVAYSKSVLVAAAGNDTKNTVFPDFAPVYPAAYNYVLGVMAGDQTGTKTASFSNYDTQRRNSIEYELVAPGVSILSTLPGNRTASWNGTSMAAPIVSAAVALMRSKYSDKSQYSSRFIMGQLVGTADTIAVDPSGAVKAPAKLNVFRALSEEPKPELSYLDYYIFDGNDLSDSNNGNGVAEPGETIALAVGVRNHWGNARETQVTLDALSVYGKENPYVEWITNQVNYGDVGTFNTIYNGLTYDEEGVINGVTNPFLMKIADDAPNDYICAINVTMSCYTESESGDRNNYTFHSEDDVFHITLRRGVELPRRIKEDMTLTKDKFYILPGNTLIEEGVTVTVEAGTQIQFWGDYSKETYAQTDVAALAVDGTLLCQGSEEEPIEIFPSESMNQLEVKIQKRNSGKIDMKYTKVANPNLNVTTVEHCYFTQLDFSYMCYLYHSEDGKWYHYAQTPQVYAEEIIKSRFYQLGYLENAYWPYRLRCDGKLTENEFDNCGLEFNLNSGDEGNTFVNNSRLVESQWGDKGYVTSKLILNDGISNNVLRAFNPVKNPYTGRTYAVVNTGSIKLADEYVKKLGGYVAVIQDEEEKEFIFSYIKKYYGTDEQQEEIAKKYGTYIGSIRLGCFDITGTGKMEWYGSDEEGVIYPDCKNSCISICNPSEPDDVIWSWNTHSELLNDVLSDTPYASGYTLIEVPGGVNLAGIQLEDTTVQIDNHTVDMPLGYHFLPDIEFDNELEWRSSNEEIVKVTDGKLTGIAPGTATVTVTVKGEEYSDSCEVTVLEYKGVTGIMDAISACTLVLGDEKTLTPTVQPADASNSKIVWSSADPAIVTVNTEGKLTATGVGTTVITAKTFDGGFEKNYTITVTPAKMKELSLSKKRVALELEGDGEKLTANYSPKIASTEDMKWVSGDDSIVCVDEKGKLTPVGKGTTVVYVKSEYSGKSASCVVTVDKSASLRVKKITPINSYGRFRLDFQMEDDSVYSLGTMSDETKYSIPRKLPEQSMIQKESMGNSSYYYALYQDGSLWRKFNDPSQGEDEQLQSGVKQIRRIGWDMLAILSEAGKLYYCSMYDNKVNEYSELTGIQQIESDNNYDVLYALDRAGTIWKMASSGGFPWTVEDMGNIEPVEELFYSDYGVMGKGEYGAWYLLESSKLVTYIDDTIDNEQDLLDIHSEIKRIVPLSKYWNEEDIRYSLLILLEDGRLAFYRSMNDSLGSAPMQKFLTLPESDDYSKGRLYWYDGLDSVKDLMEGAVLFESGEIITFGWDKYPGDGSNVFSSDAAYGIPWFGAPEEETDPYVQTISIGDTKQEAGSSKNLVVTGAAIDSCIQITFDKELIEGSGFSDIAIRDEQGDEVEADVWLEDDTIIIRPEDELEYEGKYSVTLVSGMVTDMIGNNITRYLIEIETEAAGAPETFSLETGLRTRSLINLSMRKLLKLAQLDYPTTEYSPDISQKLLDNTTTQWQKEYLDNRATKNNAILVPFKKGDTDNWIEVTVEGSQQYSIAGNYWGTKKTDLIDKIIFDENDNYELGSLSYTPYLSEPSEQSYPFVTDIQVKNAEGEVITEAGIEEITVDVFFNRDMNQEVQPQVFIGSDYPYADFSIEGDWKDARTWEGTYKVSAMTGSGRQYFRVQGAQAAEDAWLETGNDYERFGFDITTSGAKAMNLQASGSDDAVELSWFQDDYDTLAGYNLYRSESGEEGTFSRINNSLITDTVNYEDTDVEPGKEYYYYFTVVQTDLSESKASNIASATVLDTIAPEIVHNAIAEAAIGSNIPVAAFVTDNIAVTEVYLYYRIQGEETYSKVEMKCLEDSNMYRGVIPGDASTEAGLEYYIEATDGSNTVSKSDNPYQIETYPVYHVDCSGESEHGTLYAMSNQVKAGDTVQLVVEPEEGYRVKSLVYEHDGNEYMIFGNSFVMPAADVIVKVTYESVDVSDLGDINFDGKIDVGDAMLILKSDCGLIELTTEQQESADVNRDGRVDSLDASLVLQYSVGNLESFL